MVFCHAHVRGDVILGEVFVDVLEAAEHTETLHSPCAHVGAVAVCDLTVDVVGFPVHEKHLVVGKTGVESDFVAEVLADVAAPVDRKFNAILVHLTVVHRGRLYADSSGDRGFERHEHFAVPCIVAVNSKVEVAVDHVHVDTGIEFVALVPVCVAVDRRFVVH